MTRSLLIVLGVVAAGMLVVTLSHALLLLFGAVLLAALLDAAVGGVMRITRLGRGWALAVTLVLITAVIVGATAMGGRTLFNQFGDLFEVLADAWVSLRGYLSDLGLYVPAEMDIAALWEYGAEARSIFGYAGSALGMTMGLVGNLVIIVLLAIFLAASPKTYRDGLLKLVPLDRRARLGEVLDKTGSILKWWFVGQLLLMVIITISTAILLLVMGIPYAILLGIMAGILNFIPFLGPILAMVPIILALVGQDWTIVAIVLVLYTLIQQIEGNVLAPLIHQRVIDLSPGLTIAFLFIMGVLFGGVGVALATPLLAALRVMVLELYVRDVLHDPDVATGGKAQRGKDPA